MAAQRTPVTAALREAAVALRHPPAAMRDAASALLWSRVVVWVAGLVALGAFGLTAGHEGFDPAGRTTGFGAVGDALLGPAARWDAVWFLSIPEHGYAGGARPAFFPLYPALLTVFGWLFASNVLGALFVSFTCTFAALVIVHRLVALELGERHARNAVLCIAFFPTAFFLSAIYSESLFLALSAGAFLAARHDRWALAGLLGGLAAMSRSVGIVLLVPLLIIYLYGPRARSPAKGPPGRRWLARALRGRRAALEPRYRVRRDIAWLALVPAGLALFVAYLAIETGDPWAPFQAQDVWYRSFAGPFLGVLDGFGATWDGARQLLSGARTPVYFSDAGGDPFEVARRNLVDFAFLVFAVVATVGVFRVLPLAYGSWCVAALALPLSYPVGPEPLMSMPRFVLVLFPLHMWLALRLGDRGLAVSAGGLALGSAMFTTWAWVA